MGCPVTWQCAGSGVRELFMVMFFGVYCRNFCYGAVSGFHGLLLFVAQQGPCPEILHQPGKEGSKIHLQMP